MLCGRLPRLDVPGSTYFITCCIEGRRRLLQRSELANLILRLYVDARDRNEIALHAYVVMPDHYHMILTLCGEHSISVLVRRIHSLFWREGAQWLPSDVGRLWQRRFYDHVVRDERDWEDLANYIHGNPVAASLTEDPIAYQWSSCRYWQTGAGPICCDPLW
jgi:putative transposase